MNPKNPEVPTADFTLSLRVRVDLPRVHKPEPIESVTINRDPEKWTLQPIVLDQRHRRKPEPETFDNPAEGWVTFIDNLVFTDVAVFVSPGDRPVHLSGVTADPCRFQVWDVVDDEIIFQGSAIHRLEAMTMAKRIWQRGGHPMVMSPHLHLDAEWDSEEVESCSDNESRSSNGIPIPNVDPANNDRVCSPIEIIVPMVLIENSIKDHSWYPEAMDRSAAERMVEIICAGHGATASVVEVPIVLPCASDINDVLSDLRCEPVRIQMSKEQLPDPFARIADQIRSEAEVSS